MFSSNANTGFNSFGNVNESWGAQGGFGINPAYASPAFMAPYRPPYQGGHVANQNPGFFRSLYGISPFNFQGAPYGVDTHGADSNFFDSLQNRPSDLGMAGMQRFGAPLLAFGGAMAFARAWQTQIPGGAIGGGLRAWNGMFGGAGAATMSGFTNMGARFMGGGAQGMITGMFGASAMSSMAARGVVGAAGAVGGALGGIGLPLLAAQGAISAFDSMVSDNYIGMRENANVMRSGFRGVTFGGGMGDQFTGGGLSRRSAGRMGTELAQFGAKDQVFNSREIASMSSMSAQMGLLDNVSSDQLVSRMKSIVNQVKAVMSIAGTTEFKEAIQIMARLQMAGVSPGNLSGVLGGLGSLSSQAGISTGRMMSTVGAQGQYLFQANGLTPYIGQITAATAMAGFGSAFRSGFVSPELMARMGGVEGATQSSLTGQLNAAQTTYNMMRGFNRYTSGRGDTGDVVGNVGRFGESFANNPFRAHAAMRRTGTANISRMMRDEGPMAILNQAREVAALNPTIVGPLRDQDDLYGTLLQMGMDDNQARAHMAELSTYQDPRTMAMRRASIRSNRITGERDYLQQTEQTFAMTIPGVQSVVGGIRSARSGVAGLLGNFYEGGGGLFDSLSRRFAEVNVGTANSLAGATAKELSAQDSTTRVLSYKKQTVANQTHNRMLSEYGDDIRTMMRIADEGDSVARRAMRGDHDAIQKMADRGVIDSKYTLAASANDLAMAVLSLPKETGNRLQQRINQLEGDLKAGIFGDSDPVGALQNYAAANELREKLTEDKEFLERSPEGRAKARALFGKNLSIHDLEQKLVKASSEMTDYGIDPNSTPVDRELNEGMYDYALRTGMRFDMRTANRSSNASDADKVKQLDVRKAKNRGERIMDQTRQAMANMGRIDLVASYDMINAANKLNNAAEKLDSAADKLGGNSNTRSSSTPARTSNNMSYNVIGGGTP